MAAQPQKQNSIKESIDLAPDIYNTPESPSDTTGSQEGALNRERILSSASLPIAGYNNLNAKSGSTASSEQGSFNKGINQSKQTQKKRARGQQSRSRQRALGRSRSKSKLKTFKKLRKGGLKGKAADAAYMGLFQAIPASFGFTFIILTILFIGRYLMGSKKIPPFGSNKVKEYAMVMLYITTGLSVFAAVLTMLVIIVTVISVLISTLAFAWKFGAGLVADILLGLLKNKSIY